VRTEAPQSARVDHRSLAATLAPALTDTCNGRLGDINWFKADWQRGGAATGNALFQVDEGDPAPVVLKLPVVRRELTWLRRLQDADDDDPVVPRVLASGDSIDGYDLTWIVMERFPFGPLGRTWHEDHIPRVAEAAARFHREASRAPVDEPPKTEPWDELINEAIEAVRINTLEDAREWTSALKTLRSRLDPIVAEWRARDVDQWLHGDLHLANAMSRVAMDHGPVSLIDLAEVHAGHWVEDAVYFERQLWARPERLKKHRPVRAIAAARKRLGLPVGEGDARLAMIRRLLLAASAPRFLRSEGHPRHLAACLRWLRTGLAEVK
jgi:Ser/Thr protein kinase RdoA (MazF antagonist)